MKAQELRVGNLVKLNDQAETITDIVSDHGKYFVDTDKHISIFLDNQSLRPIPLTEEWLVKFGFDKPAHSWIGSVFHLSEWDEYPLNWCVAMNKNNAVVVLKLRYVHQLQNLYFALTGKELELKSN